MNSTITTIEGVADLVHQMEQEVDRGTIRLSDEAWAEFNRDLEEARQVLLKMPDVNEESLEQVDKGLDKVAWEVMVAFEGNETLREHFAKALDELQAGTIKTSIVPKVPKQRRKQLKNKKVRLSRFTEWVKCKTETSNDEPKEGKADE